MINKGSIPTHNISISCSIWYDGALNSNKTKQKNHFIWVGRPNFLMSIRNM